MPSSSANAFIFACADLICDLSCCPAATMFSCTLFISRRSEAASVANECDALGGTGKLRFCPVTGLCDGTPRVICSMRSCRPSTSDCVVEFELTRAISARAGIAAALKAVDIELPYERTDVVVLEVAWQHVACESHRSVTTIVSPLAPHLMQSSSFAFVMISNSLLMNGASDGPLTDSDGSLSSWFDRR